MTRLALVLLTLAGCGTARQPTLEQRVNAICSRSHAVIAATRFRTIDNFDAESLEQVFAIEYRAPVGVH